MYIPNIHVPFFMSDIVKIVALSSKNKGVRKQKVFFYCCILLKTKVD